MNTRFKTGGVLVLLPVIVPMIAAAIACKPNRAVVDRSHQYRTYRSWRALSEYRGSLVLVSSNAATGPSVEARATAESMFGDRCAVCHGAEGDGKGPGSPNLNPKPVDFHNRKWQGSVSDEKIAKCIVYGGPAVGLSAAMSANPDLVTQPSVVAALVEHIRKLGK